MVGIGRGTSQASGRRGDIHFVTFPDTGGNVIRGPHPAAVVQTDRLANSSTVVVVPMTSAAKAAEFDPPFLVRVRARASGLPRDGFAKCDQPVTLPRILLGPKVGRLNPETLERIDRALRFVFDVG